MFSQSAYGSQIFHRSNGKRKMQEKLSLPNCIILPDKKNRLNRYFYTLPVKRTHFKVIDFSLSQFSLVADYLDVQQYIYAHI